MLLAVAGLARSEAATSSFAGANGKLAFTSLDGGIYVFRPEADPPSDISSPSSYETNPAWSPEGTKLVYSGIRDGNLEVLVMNSDGSGETRLTRNPGADFNPVWSPDGSRIAFTGGSPRRIHVMKADGSSQQAIGPPSAGTPDWSPDGSLIAFASFGTTGIAVMRPDGSGFRQLTQGAFNELYPSWTPEGRRIAFESDRDGTYEIWVMNADGSSRTRLTSGSRFVCAPGGCSIPRFHPSWSPDGRQIAFTHDREGRAQVYVMNADGSSQRRLTSHNLDAMDVSWQPAVDLVAAVRAPKRVRVGRRANARVMIRNASQRSAAALVVRVSGSGAASIHSIRGAACSRGRTRVCRLPQLSGGSSAVLGVALTVRRAGRGLVSVAVANTRPEANGANNRARATFVAKRR